MVEANEIERRLTWCALENGLKLKTGLCFHYFYFSSHSGKDCPQLTNMFWKCLSPPTRGHSCKFLQDVLHFFTYFVLGFAFQCVYLERFLEAGGQKKDQKWPEEALGKPTGVLWDLGLLCCIALCPQVWSLKSRFWWTYWIDSYGPPIRQRGNCSSMFKCSWCANTSNTSPDSKPSR